MSAWLLPGSGQVEKCPLELGAPPIWGVLESVERGAKRQDIRVDIPGIAVIVGIGRNDRLRRGRRCGRTVQPDAQCVIGRRVTHRDIVDVEARLEHKRLQGWRNGLDGQRWDYRRGLQHLEFV